MKVCSGNKTRKFGDFEAMLFNMFGCLSEFESYLVHLKQFGQTNDHEGVFRKQREIVRR